MEPAAGHSSLIEAILGDRAFRVVATAVATGAALLVGRSFFGDPWFAVLGNMSGLIATGALLVLLLRIIKEAVVAIREIGDEIDRWNRS